MPGTSTTTRRPRGRVVSSEWLMANDPRRPGSYRNVSSRARALRGDQRKHPNRTPTAINDLKRCREHDRAGCRQTLEVAEAREAEFPGAVHDVVVGEGRIEASRLSRIGADRFD